MAKIKLATWNINSVRLRAPIVKQFSDEFKPDILCLQEIKCATGEFPIKAFEEMGYSHFCVRGQKGWHGVAIASKIPLQDYDAPEFCQHGHARVASVRFKDVVLHNLYVPAGGDIPNPQENDKFAHKLDFLSRMKDFYSRFNNEKLIVVGDLNIAPHENDVWSHKALLDVVSHTPIETQTMAEIIAAGGFCDIARAKAKDNEKLYSWWSYRSPNWRNNNRGRRLDHIWGNQKIIGQVNVQSFHIFEDARDFAKPSDHVPVMVELEV